jgi:hypothetical protein
VDPAIPARALLATDQGCPHSNYIEASIRWTRPRARHCLRALYCERAACTSLRLMMKLATDQRAQRRGRTNFYMCHLDHLLQLP